MADSVSNRSANVRQPVVLITGSSSGLGLRLAHRYGKHGAKLVLCARNISALQTAKADLIQRGSVPADADILLVACNVASPSEVSAMIDKALSCYGRVDVLINNAGIIQVGPIESQTVDSFRETMQTNFFGAVHTIDALLPHMLTRGSGKIVNIASIGGKFAMPHLLPYVASKFALVGYSEGLHSELRQKGINVTTVCPGLMRTGSHTHAKFSGDRTAEARWFSLAATTPIVAVAAQRAADQIFNAEQSNRAEITISPQAWLAARLVGLAPETMQTIGSLVNQHILPSAPSPSGTHEDSGFLASV